MATLLERDDNLSQLDRVLAQARTGGQLVVIAGEAGIGKSSLLQAWSARQAKSARWLWGYCEALGTPRPLGPLLDMAADLGPATSSALASEAPRHDVFAAVLADLASHAAVVCIEDLQWADDATIDWLQFLARRLHLTRAVLALTWRADEVGADHIVHRILGAVVPSVVHRIVPAPLSRHAVEALAGPARNVDAVLALTRGNPFLVTELVTRDSEEADVPASVRDAVLARRSRLDSRARSVLDVVAVVPARVELALLRDAAGEAIDGLDGAVSSGLLVVEGAHVQFRHELARMAVAGALSAPRAQTCHGRVLAALLKRPSREALLARIVHHAQGADDIDAILAHAPAAARQAATVGAHRQAVQHYQRTLAHVSLLADATRTELTEALAYEHYLTGDIAAAQAARQDALQIATRTGDRLAVGRNTRWLSRLAWFVSDGAQALSRADEAIAVLAALPEGPELAMAYSNRSQIAMLREDYDGCLEWGSRAIELARRLGATDILSHALNNVGTTRAQAGEPEGRALLDESLALAKSGDWHEHVARTYTNMGSTALEWRMYDVASRAFDEGLAYCAERDLDSWTYYMRASRARARLETGLWQAAVEDAESVLEATGAQNVARIVAMLALALVRTRRGDPGASAVLDDALAAARRTGEPQRLIPLLQAKAEQAWWGGRNDEVEAAAREALASIGHTRRIWDRQRACFWLWKVGALDPSMLAGDGPDVLMVAGDWKGAAAGWARVGCPYERAQALAEGDQAALAQAVDIFAGLGAAPAVDWVRQRLRDLGVTHVPRGRRQSTHAHPAGLTVRETEVLALLAEGLSNPQIADRIFVSPKTVEHHVSSILGKLDAGSREAAVGRARREGWLAPK